MAHAPGGAPCRMKMRAGILPPGWLGCEAVAVWCATRPLGNGVQDTGSAPCSVAYEHARETCRLLVSHPNHRLAVFWIRQEAGGWTFSTRAVRPLTYISGRPWRPSGS